MKRIYLFFVFLLAVFSNIFATAGVDSEKLLDYVVIYSGDEISSKILYTYNEDGSLKQTETLMPDRNGDLANNSKKVYGYDSEGRMSDYESYVWHASSMTYIGSPELDPKKHITYGADGKTSEVDYYKWDSNTAAWGEHVYMHGVYNYQDGNVIVEDRERWLNDKWNPGDRRRYVCDEKGRTVVLVRYNCTYKFEVGDYVYTPTDSIEYSYDDNDNILEQTSYMNLYDDVWGISERNKYEYTYDEYGNISRKVTYKWTDWLEQWDLLSDLTYENHYVKKSDALELPYRKDFANGDTLDDMVIEDGNEDGTTWKVEDGMLVCSSSVKSEAPEILYTPAIEMSTGYQVKVAFNARLKDESKPVQMQMILCSNDDEMSPLGTIGDIHKIESAESSEIYGYIVAPKDGAYRIGLTFDNNCVGGVVCIDTLSVYNYCPSNTPTPPYGLSAIAANDMSLQIQLDFYAPMYSVDGGLVSHVDKMEVYRNDSEEPVYTTGQVGASLVTRWIDTNAVKGENVYKIYAYANGQRSDAATIMAVAGYARPDVVKNLSVVEDESHSCTVSWEKPDGINGGELYDSPIYYTVIRNNEVVVAQNITETSAVDNTIELMYDQTYVFYVILSNNASGEGRTTVSEMYFVGEPYKAPYAESFAGGNMSTIWMAEKLEGLNSAWGIGDKAYSPDTDSQDNDGGLASFMSTNVSAGTVTRFTSAKIDISNLEEPALSFYIYQTSAERTMDRLAVEVSRNDGKYHVVADTIYVSGNQADGWAKKVISLEEYKGEESLRLSFVGVAAGVNNINIDNISVQEMSEVGIADNAVAKHLVYADGNGNIVVVANEESNISIYNLNGQKVYSSFAERLCLGVEAGIYIVDIDGVRYKVII